MVERIGLSPLTNRIAAELDHMAWLAAGLQVAFSSVLHAGDLNTAELASLQAIDRLTQLLADLSRLMAVVADAAPPSASLTVADLREVIVLRDFLYRMTTPDAGRATDGPEQSAGEVQWL